MQLEYFYSDSLLAPPPGTTDSVVPQRDFVATPSPVFTPTETHNETNNNTSTTDNVQLITDTDRRRRRRGRSRSKSRSRSWSRRRKSGASSRVSNWQWIDVLLVDLCCADQPRRAHRRPHSPRQLSRNGRSATPLKQQQRQLGTPTTTSSTPSPSPPPASPTIVYPIAKYPGRLNSTELVEQRRNSVRHHCNFRPVKT